MMKTRQSYKNCYKSVVRKTLLSKKYLTKVPVSYNYYEDIKLESKTKMYFQKNCCNKKLEGVDGIMELEEDKFIFMKRKDD